MQQILNRDSDQNIIVRQGILMQILLVVGLKIVLFTNKHTVTADERLLPIDTRPQNRLVRIRVIALV